MEFTFLTTTTESPAPGKIQTKQMRAHVTKANFARRRQRLAKEGNSQKQKTGVISQRQVSPQCQHVKAQSTQLMLVEPTDPDRSIQYLLYNFRPILFPRVAGIPTSTKEANWIELLRSEPALIEATLALCERADSISSTRTADIHASNAISIINKRIESGAAASSDGVLGAVFTLAYCERVSRNKDVMEVHLDGLGQMLKIRRSRQQYAIPAWFSDLLLYDAVSERLAVGMRLHTKIVYTLQSGDEEILDDLAHISEGVHQFLRAVELSQQYDMPAQFMAYEIDKSVVRIEAQAHALRGEKPYMNALSMAIVIFLHLSWERSPLSTADLGDMSAELMDSLAQRDVRLCSSLDLTVWQIMVGGVSATNFTARHWFAYMLKKYYVALRVKTWDHALSTLSKAFVPDPRLLSRFKSFWEEVDSLEDRPYRRTVEHQE